MTDWERFYDEFDVAVKAFREKFFELRKSGMDEISITMAMVAGVEIERSRFRFIGHLPTFEELESRVRKVVAEMCLEFEKQAREGKDLKVDPDLWKRWMVS